MNISHWIHQNIQNFNNFSLAFRFICNIIVYKEVKMNITDLVERCLEDSIEKYGEPPTP